jgi:polyisoprenoid-binding protein YceI
LKRADYHQTKKELVKISVLVALLVLTGYWTQAQYKPVDKESTLKFSIKNLGFGVNGSFAGFQGDIHFDPAHPTDAAFDVNIDANTVNTDNSMRDDHLRAVSYFDVKNHPRIHFVSEKVMASNKKGVWILFGKLTIKNRTKDISFPFSATASGGGYLFDGSFSINRRDFEVGGTSTISDKLDVTLHVLAK